MNALDAPPEKSPPDFKAQAGELARQLLSLFPAGTLVLAVLASLTAVVPALNRLCLDLRSSGDPWRPFAAHLAHGSWTHFLSNILVFVPVSMLRERRVGTFRHIFEFTLLAVFVAAGVRALHSSWTSYCGLSGVTYGLLAALLLEECRAAVSHARFSTAPSTKSGHDGAWPSRRRPCKAAPEAPRWVLPAMIFLALCFKSALELSAGGWLFSSAALEDTLGVVYLPGSHCAGILGGVFLASLSFKLDAEVTSAPATAGGTR